MNDQRINQADMMAMLHLTNRLHELPPNPIVRHEHMLAELCRMIGATAGFSALLDMRANEKHPHENAGLLFLVYHGFDDEDRQSKIYDCVRAMEDSTPSPGPLMRLLALPQPIPATPAVENKFAPPGPRIVREPRRRPDGSFLLGDSVASILELRGTRLLSALSFHRGRRDRHPFSRRERLLVRLFHSQIEWMFRTHLPPESSNAVESLTPRQQQTLRCLLAGDSEKQIAGKLARSQHTVHSYVKGIYRNLGVSSRGELLSLFVR